MPFIHQATYAASTKSDKTKMSTNIVTQLLNSNPPRRFLEKDETGNWQEVPLKRAVTKTSQALRDVARDRAKAAAAAKGGGAENTIEGPGEVAAVTGTSPPSLPLPNNTVSNTVSKNTAFAVGMPSNHLPAPNLYDNPTIEPIIGGRNSESGHNAQEQVADSSVDLFLNELNSGMLDNIIASGVGDDFENSDDNFSLGLGSSGAGTGDGEGMKQEIAVLDWIKSTKMTYSLSSGVEAGGGEMTTYLESALGIAIKLTEFIINSNEGKDVSTSGDGSNIHYSVPLECITLENTVVCIKDILSVAPQEDDTTVAIKCPPSSMGAGVGDIGKRLYAVGKILVPLLSGETGDIMEEANNDSKRPSLTLDSMTLDSSDDNFPKKRRQTKKYLPARLEQLDLPQPVMIILSNVLECDQGEFVGEEAYTSFGDLIADLKLLKMEGLSRFFQNPNLQFSDKICGREKEIELINSSFNNRTGSQGVVITGAGGVGKSRMAAHIFERTRKDGGLVFATKFDQNQDVSPLAEISVIFNDLIDLFATVASPPTLLSLSNDLENALGIHAALLHEVLPSLPRIMPSCAQGRYYVDQMNIANSMRFLFCKLFEILISYQIGRIAILFDDLQWADAASLSLISSLLHSNEGVKRVYFTSCYRDDEVNEPFLAWLQSISVFSLDEIKLQSLTPDGVNQFVSETLHLFPRLTRPLSSVLHQKTGGNPLFLGQILSAIAGSGRASPNSSPLSKGDEMYFSLSRRRWTWDIDKVWDLELADDVVSFIVHEMKKLSPDLLFGLKVAACIGSRITSDVIDILSAELSVAFTDMTLVDVLHKVAQKGFLNEHTCSPKKDCCSSSSTLRFEFVHDKIYEAAYAVMSNRERRLNHMRFGLALYPREIDRNNDKLLFMAINQINVAGRDSVVDGDQKHIIAGLNLNAGKRAGKRSDFQTAFSLFQHGISYLDADCWENHYGTSIELYESAAQAAVVVNNLEAVTSYCTVINSRAKCLEDKLGCMFAKFKALIHGNFRSEATEYFMQVMKDLGEPALLPVNEIHGDIMAMNSVMNGLADETLLSLSTMKQKKTKFLVKMYCEFYQVMVFLDPSLLQAIALRNMQLTVQEGLCSRSPLVFAHYAQSLSFTGYNTDESIRFARLSKILQERMGSSECGTLFSVFYYIMGLARPLQAITEEFKLSKKTGEQSGDRYAAIGSFCLLIVMEYTTGEPLRDVRRKSIDCVVQMKDQNMMAFYGLQALLHSQLAVLVDGPQMAEAESVDDIICGEKKTLATAGNNFEMIATHETNLMVRAFLFRRFDILSSIRFFDTISDPTIRNDPFRYMSLFFAGLASFHLARVTGAAEKKWTAIGDTILEKMEYWNKYISWNFQNKLLLLKAEKMHCLGEAESAALLYKQSIKSAQDHKFIHEEGISHELCGHFHLDRGHRSEALRSFNSSVECYMNWGALAVARRLDDFVRSTFCS